MNTRIIDARNRFSPKGREISRQGQEQSAPDRTHSQQLEAKRLREVFKGAPLFDEQDRKILVRSLGRLIERRFPDDFRRVAGEVLRMALGEEGGLSAEKKRKRYIRFDGERMPDHQPGEYLANRLQFLRIIDALASRFHGASITELQREQILLTVCDGTSFYGQTRPRLLKEMDLPDQFCERMQEMIDRIARDTDIVAYLDEVRHYTIETYPRNIDDCTEETLNSLNRQCLPVERFEHAPQGVSFSTDEYSRLHLRGFDIRGEAPSSLYPRIRLARIYWPRQVLCLKVGVPASVLHDIQTRELTDSEMAEARSNYDQNPFLDVDQQWYAVNQWREEKERDLRDAALRSAGYDPANIDWEALEDPDDRGAAPGAEWRTFWQTSNVDLHLIADEVPEALRLGVVMSGIEFAWWTEDQKNVLVPMDDDVADSMLECIILDESANYFPWFPANDQMLICRGLYRSYRVDLPPDEKGFIDSDLMEDVFDPKTPEVLQKFREMARAESKVIAPVTAHGVWDLLTLRMGDWQEKHYNQGSPYHRNEEPPSLRPLFAAPTGWTPAPDGTIVSAILRSLAYGEGDERLDMKMKKSVNDRVACLRHMKDELARTYNASLAGHGYGDEGTDA